MTAAQFRRLALDLPHAVESAHMNHPDFRVGGKIFATLGYPDAACAMVKLTAEQQRAFMHAEPQTFRPVKGGWGRRGSTQVRLAAARTPALRSALESAWRNVAPKRLLDDLG
jgi:hypothetical protein